MDAEEQSKRDQTLAEQLAASEQEMYQQSHLQMEEIEEEVCLFLPLYRFPYRMMCFRSEKLSPSLGPRKPLKQD